LKVMKSKSRRQPPLIHVMFTKRAVLLVAICLLILPNMILAKPDLRLNGYYKNFSVVYDDSKYVEEIYGNAPASLGMVSNRVRINAGLSLTDWLDINAAYNIVPKIQDQLLFSENLFYLGLNSSGYRVDDLNSRLYPSNDDKITSFAIYQNLDNFHAHLKLEWADIYAGRQAIAWGSARTINPTDVIAPYTYNELDTEYRIGVDAVRTRIPVGFMGEIDFGYVFGHEFKFEQSAFFLRGKYYVAKTDVSAMLVGFRENLMIGLDMTRSLGGAGCWVEAAWVFNKVLADSSYQNNSDYGRLTVGADYSFGSKTYGFVEYHFNQPGSNQASRYSNNLSKTAYQDGAVYLLGKHYLIPGISYQITPLLTLTCQTLTNLGDPSVSLSPILEYNVATDIYISVGAYLGIGKQSRLDKTSSIDNPRIDMKSEFGTYPAIYYLSYRWYF